MPLVIAITGPPQDLLLSALYNGIFLKCPEIDRILLARNLEKPKGRKKVQLAEHLITSLFPDETDQKKQFMIASIMTKKSLNEEEAPQLLLKLVAALDVSEAAQFSRVKARAADDLACRAMKEKRAKASKGNQHEDHDDSGLPPEEREPGQAKRKRDVDDGNPPQSSEPGPSQARMEAVNPDTEGLQAKAAATGAARAQRVKAPPELLNFLPPVSRLYLRFLQQSAPWPR